MDDRTTVVSSNLKQFHELEEFSTYRVEVIAVFGINFGILTTALASANFITLGAGMIASLNFSSLQVTSHKHSSYKGSSEYSILHHFQQCQCVLGHHRMY